MSSATHSPNLHDLHDEQIVALLRTGTHAQLLSAYFGEQLYRELCHYAKLAATRADPQGPVVYVLPGIMGSKLGVAGAHIPHIIWLHPVAIAAGGLLELAASNRRLHACGVMLPGYLKLKLMLEIAGFRPRFFPFDWRRDLFELGAELLEHIETSGERNALIVAHSMGGLVARAAMTLDTKSRIEKLVQLGAPNGGSFAPVQALRGVYPTVRKIAALDQRHTAEHLARNVFLSLPGLYQMLPSPELCEGPDLFDVRSWPQDEFAPDEALLTQARATRARLCAADERCFVVAGIRQETITGVRLIDNQFEYRTTRNGDGTVPSRLAMWHSAKTWYVQEAHGPLTNNDTVLAALVDILRASSTRLLSTQAPRLDDTSVRLSTDRELRQNAIRKVHWESLSLDTRRRILEPVVSPEFL
jgi:pimeloyl-ACP methyl ester carboxylesterase